MFQAPATAEGSKGSEWYKGLRFFEALSLLFELSSSLDLCAAKVAFFLEYYSLGRALQRIIYPYCLYFVYYIWSFCDLFQLFLLPLFYDFGVCLKIYSDGAVSQYAWQARDEYDFCSYGERKDDD